MRVAIQGELGSYHHIAAEAYFGHEIEIVCCATFADTFQALREHNADTALVAVENSIAGTVHATYDLLLSHDFFITGEVFEHIHHCLIGQPNAPLEQIARVYSHHMALPQCSDFLDQYLPQAERIEYKDTAASVAHVKELADPTCAAIASKLAAELNGLPVLRENIENYQNNVTRFVILSANRIVQDKTDKASIVLETAHRPGALYHALSIFAETGANLTKLESRPIAREPWHYQFLIDLEIGKDELEACKRKLEKQQCTVRILGEYLASNKTSA